MTTLVAEICQNHNGDRRLLAELIEQAAEHGADIVKMQSIFSTDLTKRDRFENGIIDNKGVIQVVKRPYQEEFDRLLRLDLSYKDCLFFIEHCRELSVIPLTTIFSRQRIPALGDLPWPERVVKVASYDCASWPMLRELSERFDHLIISTGASYDKEIEFTAKLMEQLGKTFTFLHCVTSYPNSLESCNLSRIEWLKQFTPQVGWSDHTLVGRDGLIAAKTAIMLGASCVERHFTILTPDKTKDGPVSITPTLLKELRNFDKLSKQDQRKEIENEMPSWEIMLGASTRELTHAELLNRDYYRGRFASRINHEWINNWDNKPVF